LGWLLGWRNCFGMGFVIAQNVLRFLGTFIH
jgi:hypothetical protein